MNNQAYFFGTPLRRRERVGFLRAMLRRYGKDYNQIYQFFDDVLDRISDKSASLLAFNSIFAGLSFALYSQNNLDISLGATMLSTLSCLLLLDIVALNWVRHTAFHHDIRKDVLRNLTLCVRRAFIFNVSLVISLLAILSFMFSLAMTVR